MKWLTDNMHWLFSGVGAAALTFFFGFLKGRISNYKGINTPLKTIGTSNRDLEILKKFMASSNNIKIFTSSAETYRTKLISILRDIKIDKLKTIDILIRDDGSENRKEQIRDEERKWKEDIEIISYGLIHVNFKTYLQREPSIMLRGYIFDNNYALLGWYLNTGNHRHGSIYPLVLHSSNEENQNEIIKFAIKTFDFFYQC